MDFRKARAFCAALPGATRDVKWGNDEVYSVGGKMFAVFPVPGEKSQNCSFKCEPERFLELTDLPGIVPAPYLARAHWVCVKEGKALADTVAHGLLRRSYELVLAKLPKGAQRQILER
jgi:predicted DNA-binding protein (MmcQ/YjbR family)